MTATSSSRFAVVHSQSVPSSVRVLRLCSVFEPDDREVARAEFDPIGGMQNHTAALTRALDGLDVAQTVVTSRLGGATGEVRLGRAARVVRVGVPVRRARQFWALAAILPALGSGPFDVVHVHQGEDLAALPLAAALARRYRCPLIATVHCSLRHSLPRHNGPRLAALRIGGGWLEQRMLRHADAVITLTAGAAERIGSTAPRTVVIPSGVEVPLFTAESGASKLLDGVPRPRVLYLGRLARQKDVPTLVRAFAQMRTAASLVLVGDGPEREVVDSTVRNLPAPARARVHRFGFRPHREVPELLSSADVLVLPSIYEEMGSVLVEALHVGLPVVATRVGGIPSVIEHGRTGLLVPPGDSRVLAETLDELLADPIRLAAMRRAGQAAASTYRWDALARRVLSVYQTAIAHGCAARTGQ